MKITEGKMDIEFEVSGGLGNQMFRYATAYAIAKRTKCDLVIDTSLYRLGGKDEFSRIFLMDCFTISYHKILFIPRNTLWGRIRYKLHKTSMKQIGDEGIYNWEKIEQRLQKNGRYHFSGLWQKYTLFHEFRSDLLKQFRYKGEISLIFQKLSSKIKETKSVAIHIRRGDYVKLGCCLSAKYYEHAIEEIEKRIGMNTTFFVFTEDPQYAHTIFDHKPYEFIFLEEKNQLTDIEVFFLMSVCSSQIITNSTFSWWSAYLNVNPDKVIIAPIVRNWIAECWEEGYFPDTWVKLETLLEENI